MTRRVVTGSLLAGGLALAPAGGATLPAQAATCAGVTVVVQFGSSPTVRCAPGDPTSGMAALSGAGFSITPVQGFGGAVCRIDGQPADMPCNRMPPASAYWSYWYAAPGGSWTYSAKGAAERDPAPGTLEGWRFGDGSTPPAYAVPAAATTSTSTRRATAGSTPRASSGGVTSTAPPVTPTATSGTTARSGSLGRSTSTAPAVGSASSRTPDTGASGARSTSATTGSTGSTWRSRRTSTSATTTSATAVSSDPSEPAVSAAPQGAAGTTSDRAWLPAVGGVVLLALIGAATVVVARRRSS